MKYERILALLKCLLGAYVIILRLLQSMSFPHSWRDYSIPREQKAEDSCGEWEQVWHISLLYVYCRLPWSRILSLYPIQVLQHYLSASAVACWAGCWGK